MLATRSVDVWRDEMLRLRSAVSATAGMALLGVVGIQGVGHAFNPIIDCNFTVTPAGNGAQVFSPNFSTVVATLQTGQVVDLFNTVETVNNIRYWNDEGFGQVGDWYPIASGTTVLMAKDQNSCTIDNCVIIGSPTAHLPAAVRSGPGSVCP
jgi:hypothetical protein